MWSLFYDDKIKDGDFIFVNFDLFYYFLDTIRNIPKRLPKFNLEVIHNKITHNMCYFNSN